MAGYVLAATKVNVGTRILARLAPRCFDLHGKPRTPGLVAQVVYAASTGVASFASAIRQPTSLSAVDKPAVHRGRRDYRCRRLHRLAQS